LIVFCGAPLSRFFSFFFHWQLGIGPAPKSAIDKFCKHLKLL